jgi:hypothetical protein
MEMRSCSRVAAGGGLILACLAPWASVAGFPLQIALPEALKPKGEFQTENYGQAEFTPREESPRWAHQGRLPPMRAPLPW